MKREDLTKLGLADEAVDAIMALHGKDIESHKAKVSTAQTEIDGLKNQLTEASATIESFKALKPEELQAAANDWKAKAEQAQADAANQIAAMKFDHALENALTGAKAKNTKAVQALLSRDALKFNETDGSIVGLDEQLKKIKSENDYLFDDATPAPKIVTGGNPKSILGDSMVDAARKAAGLPSPT